MKDFYTWWNEMANAARVGWFLAFRQIRRSSPWTTGLIVFIMTLTFLNLVVASGLLQGLMVGSFDQFRKSYSGEIIITSAPGRDYIEHSQALADFLRNDPDVLAFSARNSVGASMLGTLNDLPKKNEQKNLMSALLVGYDPDAEEAVTGFSKLVTVGQPLREGDEGYVLIGSTLIKKYSSFADANIPGLNLLKDVDVGSRVRISIPRKDGDPVTKDFVIRGVIKSKVDQVSQRFFITDAELRRLLPINKEEFTEVAIRTEPAKAAAVSEDIKRFMEGYAVRIQTSGEAIPSFLRDIETTMKVLGNALSSIALVVASITVFIVIYINAVTKRKFIGIMKGIGISPVAVQFSYVFQAIFYGFAGTSVGVLLTFGLLRPFFDAHPIDFPFSDGILVATAAGASVRGGILMIVTLLAGYIPATIIARKNTLDSILGR